jgi:hypothetical protein
MPKETEKISEISPDRKDINNIAKEAINPIWLSVSESAKIGGVTAKTIRRAIESRGVKYKIVNNRYFIELASLVNYLYSTTKLQNKLNSHGIGQYIREYE